MHIILVSDRMTTAKTLTLTWRHLILGSGLLVASVIALSTLFSYFTVRHAAELRLPFLQDLMRVVSAEETQKSRDYVRENLNAMAVKLGQMQAQLLRLDSLGERLASVSGLKLQDARTQAPDRDSRGGPLVNPSALSANELQQAVEALGRQLEARTDTLSLLEAQLFEDRVRKARLPTTLPVDAQWNASAYGWRLDPFTGQRAMHEGVDFPAEVGIPIVAAAAGVVIAAERHPEYGLMIDIDHGNDLITRYAHASKLLVQPGAFVKRGQNIAAVGNTGRSTGPHLHFEVRIKGAAQNPNRFLQMAADTHGHRH
ncbi:MAG: M23 family metallopeptidase [Sulfurisoma sp.]|nr:M23 family metallopeptidase [Sulfurisoma sp.]